MTYSQNQEDNVNDSLWCYSHLVVPFTHIQHITHMRGIGQSRSDVVAVSFIPHSFCTRSIIDEYTLYLLYFQFILLS